MKRRGIDERRFVADHICDETPRAGAYAEAVA